MNSDCLVWTKCKNSRGYGVVAAKGKQYLAHRLIYELFVGTIAPGMWILHSCDHPSCVNPAHLRQGTPKDNSKDRSERLRAMHGEKNTFAKLTDAQVLKIRASADSFSRLAKEYKVSWFTIDLIKRGKSWRHLLDTRDQLTSSISKGS